jgi:hypothetical protein
MIRKTRAYAFARHNPLLAWIIVVFQKGTQGQARFTGPRLLYINSNN